MQATGDAAWQVTVEQHAEGLFRHERLEERNADFLREAIIANERWADLAKARRVILKVKGKTVQLVERDVILRIDAELDSGLVFRLADSVVLPCEGEVGSVNDRNMKTSLNSEHSI